MMDSLEQIAQNIMKAVSNILPFPISLSDKYGNIIASTDKSRIGTFHKPSQEVICKGDFIAFDEKQAAEFDNVLPGVAVPLYFGQNVIGVLGIIGSPEDVRPHAQLIKEYVEMTWQETFHKQLKDLETKTLEAFLQYVLLNETKSKTKIQQYAQLLALDLKSKYFCIVIHLGDSLINSYQYKSLTDRYTKSAILSCIQNVFKSHNSDICAFLNVERIVMLKSVESSQKYFLMMDHFKERGKLLIKRLEAYGISNVIISAGGLYSSLQDIHQSYQEANDLIGYGETLDVSLPIYSYHDWEILLKLLPKRMDKHLKEKVFERLTPLLEDDDCTSLINDFFTYCENNMVISQAADKLFVHRNTLIYRLKKIEQLTSLKIRNFQHCALLYLSLKSYEYKR